MSSSNYAQLYHFVEHDVINANDRRSKQTERERERERKNLQTERPELNNTHVYIYIYTGETRELLTDIFNQRKETRSPRRKIERKRNVSTVDRSTITRNRHHVRYRYKFTSEIPIKSAVTIIPFIEREGEMIPARECKLRK